MRTVPSVADLTRTAAERGLTVNVGGRIFNAQADRMRAPKPTPAPPPPQVEAPPPAPAGITREELDRELAARDALWEGRMLALQSQLDRPPEPPRPTPSWQFVPEYDAKGAISYLVASPIDNASQAA